MTEKEVSDIEYILDNAIGIKLIDELSLLRIALRAYLDGADAETALAWAAEHLSDGLTGHKKPGK